MDIRGLIAACACLCSLEALSQTVGRVRVECAGSPLCPDMETRIRNLLVLPTDADALGRVTGLMRMNEAVAEIGHELTDDGGARITVSMRKRVASVTLSLDRETIVGAEDVLAALPVREGDFLDESRLAEAEREIPRFLELRGVGSESVTRLVARGEDEASVHFQVVLSPRRTVAGVEIDIDHEAHRAGLLQEFADMRGGELNAVELASRAQAYLNRMGREGFFHATEEHSVSGGGGGARVRLRVRLGTRHHFNFRGQRTFSHQELADLMGQEIRQRGGVPTDGEIARAVSGHYERTGLHGTAVAVRRRSGTTKTGIPFATIYVAIREGRPVRVGAVRYNGASPDMARALGDLYDRRASVLASRDLLDRDFLEAFSQDAREAYLSRGFVSAEVPAPMVEERPDGAWDVTYNVVEGRQVLLGRVEIEGVPDDLRARMREAMRNKEGRLLDVVALEGDLARILGEARARGYYFATMADGAEGGVVSYSETLDTARVRVVFDLGRVSRFGGAVAIGNRRTKDVVIEREAAHLRGSLLTREGIQDLENRLIGLELFSDVEITPVSAGGAGGGGDDTVNLLIRVRERPFGSGEFVPGYRTDLGAKASLFVTYNNLWGMNHVASSTLEANRRLDDSGLDPRRRRAGRRVTEGAVELRYRVPWWLHGTLFDTQWEFEAETSFTKRRLYSFDTDVLDMGYRLTKRLTDDLLASIRYQFESIRQFDATNERNEETFTLNGVTPSMVLDLRDSEVFPTRGAWFGLFWELSSGSLREDSSVDINYTKLTSRNRFYLPLGDWVLTLALSAGHQKNLSDDLVSAGGSLRTKGHIPGIKVFRLGGVDNVRGYDDGEVNRLESGVDINDVRIQDEAWFVNYKIEPRYRLDDRFTVGLFLDAGGIYVGSVRPLDVKASVGAGFKILTPVGSLDFDYGIKLKRRTYRDDDGVARDSFGRLHLTVGSF